MANTQGLLMRTVERKLKELWPDWHIDKVLGNGAFGSVYRIARELNGRSIYSALKVIRIERDSDETSLLLQQNYSFSGSGNNVDAEYRNRITKALEEINIMEELKGAPNVVRIEDFQIVWEGDTEMENIKMELLQSLFEWIRVNGFPDESSVLKIGTDICKALQYCADKKIIHRDIKPANIFIDPYGEFKLGDFGISRQLDLMRANSSLTAVGTISHMAPEVYKLESYDERADIYSLGLVLYELSNHGRMPFLPDYPQEITEREQSNSQMRRMRGELFPLPDGVSQTLGEVICKACSYSQNKRYRSALEFKRELERCFNANTGGDNSFNQYKTQTLVIKKDKSDVNKVKYILGVVACILAVAACTIFIVSRTSKDDVNLQREKPNTVVENSTVKVDEPVQQLTEAVPKQPLSEDLPEQQIDLGQNNEQQVLNEANDDGHETEESGISEKSVNELFEPDGPFFTYDGHTYCFYDVNTINGNGYGNVIDADEGAYKNIQRFCKDQGGHLAIINSVEENDALFAETQERYDYTVFFGLSDENREGRWVWADGTEDTLGLWAIKNGVQQPDNGSGYSEEHYAEFDYDRFNPEGSDNTGKWNDASYLNNTSVFICEWDYLIDGI